MTDYQYQLAKREAFFKYSIEMERGWFEHYLNIKMHPIKGLRSFLEESPASATPSRLTRLGLGFLAAGYYALRQAVNITKNPASSRRGFFKKLLGT